jgi:hypothetical protein
MRPGLITHWPDWFFMQTELTWPGRTDLPGDWALYAISVPRLIALRSGFLQTPPRGNAPRGKLGIFDLPSASIYVNDINH